MQRKECQTVSSEVLATFTSWVLLGSLNVVLSSLLLPWPANGWWIRCQRQLVDFGHHLALGLLAAAAVWSWRRLVPRPRLLDLLALWAVATGVGLFALRADFAGIIRNLGERLDWPLANTRMLFIVVLSLGLSACLAVGRILNRGGAR